MMRADIELGRGDFEAARAHLEAARSDAARGPRAGDLRRLPSQSSPCGSGAGRTRKPGSARRPGAGTPGRGRAAARLVLCAKGLRAQAELAALARARRDADAVRDWLAQARKLIAIARRGAEEASAVTPNTAGWLALAEAEYERAQGVARPELWSEAAETWQQLERPPLAAYCRWREAEALVAAGASRVEASAPLREARAVATRIGAQPLLRELELLAERARLDLTSQDAEPPDERAGSERGARSDHARGGGPDARLPWLHQSRDRRHTRDQRQDGRASTSRTSCASSTHRTGSKLPQSRSVHLAHRRSGGRRA